MKLIFIRDYEEIVRENTLLSYRHYRAAVNVYLISKAKYRYQRYLNVKGKDTDTLGNLSSLSTLRAVYYLHVIRIKRDIKIKKCKI